MQLITKKYIRVESLSSILLFFGALLALCISNTELNEQYVKFVNFPISITLGDYSLAKPLIKWVNDGLMALFFLVLTLEAKFLFFEGELVDKSYLPLAVIAAAGGAIMPALIYTLFTFSDPILMKGWGIPIATDTAFVLGVVYFLLHKLPSNIRIFILSLSIIDDIIAVLVLAIFYTPVIHFIPLLLGAGCIIALALLNFWNINKLFPYVLLGIGLWFALIETGIHGTIAGVILGLFIPLHNDPAQHFLSSPLKRLESFLHPIVSFIVLPLFAFLNVEISFKEVTYDDFSSLVAMGIIAGLCIGKPLGIMLSSYMSVKLKFCKFPHGLSWGKYFGISILCGIGFTFSLFIGVLSFNEEYLINQMKIGVLLGSLLSCFLGTIFLLATSTEEHTRRK